MIPIISVTYLKRHRIVQPKEYRYRGKRERNEEEKNIFIVKQKDCIDPRLGIYSNAFCGLFIL